MSHLSVTPLAIDRADQAFPLVRMVSAATSLTRWRAFAALRLGGNGGILAVTAGDDMIHGVAAYRLDQDLRHGRVLRVDLFATVELNQKAPARQALFEALETRAAAVGCDAICLTLPSKGYADADAARLKGWASIGLEIDAVNLVKALPPPAGEDEPRGHAASVSGA
jgi:hypothetical protein